MVDIDMQASNWATWICMGHIYIYTLYVLGLTISSTLSLVHMLKAPLCVCSGTRVEQLGVCMFSPSLKKKKKEKCYTRCYRIIR